MSVAHTCNGCVGATYKGAERVTPTPREKDTARSKALSQSRLCVVFEATVALSGPVLNYHPHCTVLHYHAPAPALWLCGGTEQLLQE